MGSSFAHNHEPISRSGRGNDGCSGNPGADHTGGYSRMLEVVLDR